MKVFIAGGTGVLGKRLVPKLLDLGYDVGVLSRSDDNEKTITQWGATPVTTSLFVLEDLIEKTKDYEIFLHLATKIPPAGKQTPEDWKMNTKLRTEGTKNLTQAAIANDCKFYVQQSIVFAYGHRGDELLDEGTPILKPVPSAINLDDSYNHVLGSAVDMEKIVNEAIEKDNLQATILRFGWFYSYDSENIQAIQSGEYAFVWWRDPYISLINVNDAVDAIIQSIEKKENTIGETFNVVDNEPVRYRDWLRYGYDLSKNGMILRVPGFLVKLLYGKFALNFIIQSYRVDNSKFRQSLNWKPKFPTYREGLKYELDQMETS